MITVMINWIAGFVIGSYFAKFRNDKKERKQKKRDRRNRMINTLWNMTDRKCRWDVEHERLSKAKGFRIFKGGMDKMTEAQFQAARQVKQLNDAFSDNNYRQIVDTAHQLLGRQADVTVIDEFQL